MSASVIVQHQSVGYADKSAAITAGGTSEEADAANPGRRGFYVQNISDTVMYLNFGAAAAAAAGSIHLAANGGQYIAPATGITTQSINLFCATTGKAYTVKTW